MPLGRLRIIAGQWRGRRLNFPVVEGLRPTPDRVRETLFNWLAPIIQGAQCLDLFAGSGALGLESLSRGAARVVMLDRSSPVVNNLRDHLKLLQAQGGEAKRADAMIYLEGPAEQFDLVFVDPPFASEMVESVCQRLAAGGWVRPGGLVYVECAQKDERVWPVGWSVHRYGRAGQVHYYLLVANLDSEP